MFSVVSTKYSQSKSFSTLEIKLKIENKQIEMLTLIEIYYRNVNWN